MFSMVAGAGAEVVVVVVVVVAEGVRGRADLPLATTEEGWRAAVKVTVEAAPVATGWAPGAGAAALSTLGGLGGSGGTYTAALARAATTRGCRGR